MSMTQIALAIEGRLTNKRTNSRLHSKIGVRLQNIEWT